MNQTQDLAAELNERDTFDLPALDPARIDNEVLREALVRIKDRCVSDAHADYHTTHSSHSTYSKGW